MKKTILAVALLLSAFSGLKATTYSYTATGTSTYSTTTNWSPNGTPGSGDAVVFNSAGITQSNVTGNAALASIEFGSLLSTPLTLNLSSSITFRNVGNLTDDSGNTQNVTITGASNSAIILGQGNPGAGSVAQTYQNDSSGLLTISTAFLKFGSGGAVSSNTSAAIDNLTFQGTGNTTVSAAITQPASSSSYATVFNVAQSGSGTLTLSGTNTYSGTTTVNSGILLVNGTNSGGGSGYSSVNNTYAVNSTGTLGGTGTISGANSLVTVASGGALLAGNGTATGVALTINSGLTMNSGSTLEFYLGPSGTHSTLTLSSSATNTFASGLAVDFLGTVSSGTYNNLITGLAADPTSESTWVVANGGYTAAFSYSGGDISAVVTSVPEPSTFWLLGLGFGCLALARRTIFGGRLEILPGA